MCDLCVSEYDAWQKDWSSAVDAYHTARDAFRAQSVAAEDAADSCQDLKVSCPARLLTWWDYLDAASDRAADYREAKDRADASADGLWECMNASHKEEEWDPSELESEMDPDAVRDIQRMVEDQYWDEVEWQGID